MLGWIAVAVALVAALAGGSHIFVTLDGLDPAQNQAIAAWVQAIGSIGALGAGAWFVSYQSELARRNRKRAVLAMINLAIESTGGDEPIAVESHMALHRLSELKVPLLTYVRDSLEKVPLHEIDSVEVIVAISEALEALRFVIWMKGEQPMKAAWVNEHSMGYTAKRYTEQHTKLLDLRARVKANIL